MSLGTEEAPGKAVSIQGSASIVQALERADLIDEDHLYVHPVLLGQGLPATKADLLHRLGRDREAVTAYQAALALTDNATEHEILAERISRQGWPDGPRGGLIRGCSIASMTATRRGFAARLAQGPIVLDGGLATELEKLDHDLADSLWSARLLRDNPDDIEAVHRAYFKAGADVAITASYHASFEGFAEVGVGPGETARLLRLSVEIAQRARDAMRPDGLVAASIGPYGVVFADGTEYTGDYTGVSDEQFADVHRPRIDAMLETQPDLLAFETIPALREVAALVDLLGDYEGVESWITFCCRDGERLSDGTPVEEAARVASDRGRITALGINCTPPEHIDSLLERTRAVTDLPILVYPNSGRTWDGERYEWNGVGVEGFPLSVIAGWRERGATGVGGCCGIGPAAIAGVADALR